MFGCQPVLRVSPGEEGMKYSFSGIYTFVNFLWEKWHCIQLERKGLRVVRNVKYFPTRMLNLGL